MKIATIKLDWERSTKGTHVYSDPQGDACIPTVYIRKSAFKDSVPERIQLTIETAE
jgi:hypothetical protein